MSSSDSAVPSPGTAEAVDLDLMQRWAEELHRAHGSTLPWDDVPSERYRERVRADALAVLAVFATNPSIVLDTLTSTADARTATAVETVEFGWWQMQRHVTAWLDTNYPPDLFTHHNIAALRAAVDGMGRHWSNADVDSLAPADSSTSTAAPTAEETP